MADIEMLRPYVEQKIAELLGVERVKVDAEGDIPIRAGSAVCFVRLLNGPTGPMVRIFSPLLGGVEGSPQLLAKLNQLNGAAPYVRFFHVEDAVYCALDLLADNVQREEIGNAINVISVHADQLDDLLKNEFGGRRMIEEDDAAKPAKDQTGYL